MRSSLWLLGLSACHYATVPPGDVAVVHTPDGVKKTPLGEGDWDIGIYDHVGLYSVRSQELETSVHAVSSTRDLVRFTLSVRFHVVPEEVVLLDQEIGPKYKEILVEPTLVAQARQVAGKFTDEEIYSLQREKIEREIREGMEAQLRGRHLAVEAVLMRNVEFSDEVRARWSQQPQPQQLPGGTSQGRAPGALPPAEDQAERDWRVLHCLPPGEAAALPGSLPQDPRCAASGKGAMPEKVPGP